MLRSSPQSFTVSCIIIKSFSHFEFIFICGMKDCSNFIDLYAMSFFLTGRGFI